MSKRKGQSTLEYAVIIAVVVGGLVMMQHYVKRGYAGKLKSAADDMGQQFDPGRYSAELSYNQTAHVNTGLDTSGASNTRHIAAQTSNRTGTEDIQAYDATKNVFEQ